MKSQSQSQSRRNVFADKNPHVVQPKTIIILRHGEKLTPDTSGLLTCQGLNRALNIASTFTKKPTKIYAVKPIADTNGNSVEGRPFLTIMPYAVKHNLPICVKYSYSKKDMTALVKEVLAAPTGFYVICWEHKHIQNIINDIFLTITPSTNKADLPVTWPGTDFDTIYNLQITSSTGLTFSMTTEGLNGEATVLPATQPTGLPVTDPKAHLNPAKSG